VSARFSIVDVKAALGRQPIACPDPEVVFGRVSIDSRRTAMSDLFVALQGERFDGNDFRSAAVSSGAMGVVGDGTGFDGNEGVACWEVPDGRLALQDLAAFHRDRLDPRIVAVTGSNGKTTTKELVASVLSQEYATTFTIGNLNNQVGVPLTLLEIEPAHEWAVVELGTSRLGEIAPLTRITRPHIGIITNVACSHLEGMGSLESVVDEKLDLARALGPQDLLIYCGDQPMLRRAVDPLPCRRISYGFQPENDISPESWSLDEDGRGTFVVEDRTYRLRLTGEHNILNALAAVAVGLEAGLGGGVIAVGIAEPDALPLRMQLEHWGDVIALVDCYNANPESVLSAASTLARLGGVRRKVAVLGEMLELGKESSSLHRIVGRDLADGAVDLVVAVGEGAMPIAEGAEQAGLEAERFADRDRAIRWLVDNLRPGDAILFKASRGAELETIVGSVRMTCLENSAGVSGSRVHRTSGERS
jgi:UDP-N-acetylmuramoyl-tripeptide--D-alanyl-D-alanine ligase